MRYAIAPVKNLRLLMAAAEALSSRDAGVPGIGILCGPTGYGKTTAAAWIANQKEAAVIRAFATWNPTAMLDAICRELELSSFTEGKRIQVKIDEISKHLAREGRTLIIDEADHIVDKKVLVETLRDIHDVTASPLLLIGMKQFKEKVARRDQLAGRVSQWVEFKNADIADARVLADAVCEVEVADDLLNDLHTDARGSIRGMVVGLSHIEALARKKGLKSVAAKDWDGKSFTLQAGPRANGRAA